eukprot:4570237-Amphidinium_carterae.1
MKASPPTDNNLSVAFKRVHRLYTSKMWLFSIQLPAWLCGVVLCVCCGSSICPAGDPVFSVLFKLSSFQSVLCAL